MGGCSCAFWGGPTRGGFADQLKKGLAGLVATSLDLHAANEWFAFFPLLCGCGVFVFVCLRVCFLLIAEPCSMRVLVVFLCVCPLASFARFSGQSGFIAQHKQTVRMIRGMRSRRAVSN